MSTFVSVGNAKQPFSRLLRAISARRSELPQPVFVQFGTGDQALVSECEGADFLTMDAFERQVAAAELLILHAGAGSVIHAIRAGKVPVVVPRRPELGEHIDGHQLEFTAELATTNKVVSCDNLDELVLCSKKALDLQRQQLAHHEPSALVGLVREALVK